MEHRATYSPEDNKLRLYPAARLNADEYAKVKAAGFKWAPKQELFVAPMWTPEREDLLTEMCGEIEDEDKSLVECAEERAERFSEYSENRAADSAQAHAAVRAIADNIPFGQPILVGHHSEKHARKDAEKIQNGMRRAVKMWEQAGYWKARAAGAIRAAKYKERPDVRARRIRTLEADAHKVQKNRDRAAFLLDMWAAVLDPTSDKLKKKDGSSGTPRERALYVANNYDHIYRAFPLDKYPRAHHTYEGDISLWGALGGNVNGENPEAAAIISPEEAARIATAVHSHYIPHADRWLAHYANRIAYERAMLDEAGGIPSENTAPEKGGAIRGSIWCPGRGQGWAAAGSTW